MFTLIINALIDLANWVIMLAAGALPDPSLKLSGYLIREIGRDRIGRLLFELVDVPLIVQAVVLMLALRGIWWFAQFTIRMVRG